MAQQLHDYLAGRRRLYQATQQAVADAVGVSRQTIASWEGGTTSPDIAQIGRWVGALPLTDADRADVARLVEAALVQSWQAPAEGEG